MQKESEVKAHETSYFGSADFFDVSSRGNIRLRGARPLLRRSSLASLGIMFLIIDYALKRARIVYLESLRCALGRKFFKPSREVD